MRRSQTCEHLGGERAKQRELVRAKVLKGDELGLVDD